MTKQIQTSLEKRGPGSRARHLSGTAIGVGFTTILALITIHVLAATITGTTVSVASAVLSSVLVAALGASAVVLNRQRTSHAAAPDRPESDLSQSCYRALARAIPHTLLEVDPRGGVLSLRSPENDLRSAATDFVQGLRVDDLLPGVGYDDAIDAVARAAASGETTGFCCSTGTEGERRFLDVRCCPNGDTVIVVVRDVTGEKLHEHRLQRRWYGDACLANMGQLALTIDDKRTMVDEAIKVLRTNLCADHCEIWEISADGTRLQPVGTRESNGSERPEPVPLTSSPLHREVLATTDPVIVSHPVYAAGGVDRYDLAGFKSSMLITVRGSSGPYGVIGVHMHEPHQFSEDDRHFLQGVANILAMTIENQKARVDQSQLAAAVEQAAEAIIITSPDGTVTYVNPALEQISGYHRDEMLGTNWRLWTGRAKDGVSGEMWGTLLKGEPWRGKFANIRKDGSRYEVEAVVSPVRNRKGELMHFVAVERDTSEEQRLADRLRQAQKLEAVGTLTGGIAHDFNNILSVVISNADLLASSLPQHLIDQRSDVSDIQKAARSGAAMIRKLLGFSRQADLSFEFVPVGKLVGDTSTMLSRLLPDSVRVVLDRPDEQMTVHADSGALEQVLINIATNARDAMPSGGVLRISQTRMAITEREASKYSASGGEYVRVSIEDNGTGMSEETVSRIFEPFYTTKNAGSGTGLGMAMIYGLVKQHSGFVQVESELDVGTTVHVWLPATANVTDAPGTDTEKTAIVGGCETILFAEDQASLRRTGKRVLERFGYRVVLAEDGVAALERFRRATDPIDLIVSDLVMPNMGAKELYDAVRDESPGMKFIVASGHTLRDVVETDQLDPEIPFLEKPWTLESLAGRVREVLDSE